MKAIQYITLALCTLAAIAACKKSKYDFVRDNSTPTGVGSVPVSSNGLIDMATQKTLATSRTDATAYDASATFNTELQFFSESPVKEINLFNTVGAGAKEKYSTIAYQKAFSTIKRLDTLLVPYTLPTGASGTVIRLDYEILNQNNLNVIRTIYVKLK
ncbi:hypothetical protein HHL16_02590 [Pseudoflavitalea sp. G-6-1-2]|uniref:hypothetical protein n=1 Tax=Pseudoflavitalea sp. G-6-1-2 TaxID=2728841 RepID=UPI00146DDE52|nr:hypothetical protein [Pseudoflavitalea sp. G-6-1-2]NML19740.1 hypothetical protein [Pseudoflavitalea sp. G-6-1-2]